MPLLCPDRVFTTQRGRVQSLLAAHRLERSPFVSYEEDPLAAFRRSSRHPVYRTGPRPFSALHSPRSSDHGWDRRRPPVARRRLLVAGAVVVVGVGAFFLWHRLSGSVSIEGLDDGAALGRAAVQTSEVRVEVSGRGAPKATLNGAEFGA